MSPSAINKIITAIAIFKNKLVYGLSAIVKFIDQWFTEIIFKGTFGFICHGNTNSSNLLIILNIVSAKKEIDTYHFFQQSQVPTWHDAPI